MSLNAGEVYALFGARFDPAGVEKFDAGMKKSIASAETAEKKVVSSAKRIDAATRAMGAEQQAQAAKVVAANDKMAATAARAAGVYQDSTGKWREANGRFVTSARQAELGLAGVEKQSQRTARTFATTTTASTQLQKGLANGLAGGVIAAGLAAAVSVKKYADFEQTLNVLKATAGATDRQMVDVRKTATALGNDMSLPATSAKDAADAMVELAKGGMSASQAMKAAKGVLQLSAAAQISNADAATIVVDSLNAFNLKAGESVRVADLLAASANATTASIPQMGLALQQSATSAHQLGIPIQDLVTMLGELHNAGIKGADAGTSVKTMLAALTPNSKQAAEQINRLGVQTFDAEGRFRGVRAVIDDYRDGLSKLTDEQKTQAIETIFGSDASRAAGIILEGGVKSYDKLRRAVTQAGAAQDLAKAQTQGLNGSWEALKSQVETIQIGIGAKLAPALTTGARGIADFLGEMQSGQGAGGDFVDRMEHIADVVGADVGPALAQAREEFDKIKAEFQGSGADFEAVGDAIGAAFGFLADGVGGEVVHTISAAGASVRVLGDVVRGVGAVLRGDWAGAWNAAKSAATNALHGVEQAALVITAPLRSVGEAIQEPFRSAADAVLGLFSTMLSGAAKVVGVMAGIPVIGDKFKGIAGGIQLAADSIDDLRASINQVKPPDPVIVDVEAGAAASALKRLQGTKLEAKVVKVLGQDTDARTKLNQLKALGIPTKTAKVLAAVANALSGLGSVSSMLNALHDKTINVTTVQKTFRSYENRSAGAGHATGRGPGRSEQALVGEGRHAREAVVDPASGTAFMVDRPTVIDLPDTAYVIPEDPNMRGGALGLLRMLAGDLGLKGFAKGKAPSSRATSSGRAGSSTGTKNAAGEQHPRAPRVLYGNVEATKLPLENIEKKRDAAKSKLDKAKSTADRLPKAIDTTEAQIRDVKRRKPKSAEQKANKRDDLHTAQTKLATQRDQLRQAKAEEKRQRAAFKTYEKERVQAVHFQAEITKQEQLADTAASQMRTADGKNDQAGYDKAKGKRLDALKALRYLLDRARKGLADQDSEAARELNKTIASTDTDIQDTSTDESGAQADAQRAAGEDPDLTAAQKALLARDDRDISLAALTEGLDDDKAAAGKKLDDLRAIFNSVLYGAQPTSDSLVKDVADQVKTAEDNVKALSSIGGTSNDNPDLQAQLDQANERARVADDNARIAGQALAVLGGSGDIGSGGPNALAAARGDTYNVNFHSVAAPAPQEALRLAGIVVGGMGYQATRPSKVEKVGG